MFDKKAEEHIEKILARPVPYSVMVYGTSIGITSHNVYPPGSLATMFAKFLVEKLGVHDKVIADIGSGCSTLGIIAARHGARKAVGVDINEDCISCSQMNIAQYGLEDKVSVLEGNGVATLLVEYRNSVDIVISGAPWSSIDRETFDATVKQEQAGIYRSFYDVEDALMHSLMTDGFELLKSESKRIYITAAMRVMDRIAGLAEAHSVSYEIVDSQDIHGDGNLHYILCLEQKNIGAAGVADEL